MKPKSATKPATAVRPSRRPVSFEDYVISLTQVGVFPTFHRYQKGWHCILRNNRDQQIMPFRNEDHCWGVTILEALTTAVEGLNKRFPDPKELHKYITSEPDDSIESLLRDLEQLDGLKVIQVTEVV